MQRASLAVVKRKKADLQEILGFKEANLERKGNKGYKNNIMVTNTLRILDFSSCSRIALLMPFFCSISLSKTKINYRYRQTDLRTSLFNMLLRPSASIFK